MTSDLFSAIFDLPTMSDDFYPITSNIWGGFFDPPNYPNIRRHLWAFSLERNFVGGGFMANQQRTIFTLMWRNVFPINATFRSCVKQRIHISVCKSVGFCASSILASFVSFCKDVFRYGGNTLFCLLQLDENNFLGMSNVRPWSIFTFAIPQLTPHQKYLVLNFLRS